MDLTDEDVQEFCNIGKKEFGEELTLDQARIEANNLLELAWLIVQPLPGEPGYQEPKIKDPSESA